MTSQTILITGGAGFIGANLLYKLATGNNKIHVLLKPSTNTGRIQLLIDSKKVSIHTLDLLDSASLQKTVKKIKPTVIYHLAAQGASHFQNDPTTIFQTNFIGTLNLLNASHSIPYKLFVNVGSSSEYGYSVEPMSESNLLKPNSYYAVAKAAQTQLASYTATHFNKPIVTIRPFSVYGPYESSHKLFPTILNSLLTNTAISLTSKKSAHDFIYIEDVVNGLTQIETLAKHPGEVFNFGTGTQTTLQQLMEIISQATGINPTFKWESKKNHRWDTTHWVADMSKTKKVLDWQTTPLKDGITKSWDWYKKHHQLYI